MKKMLINAAQKNQQRIAIIEHGHLLDLTIERKDQEQKRANIYKGRISSIEPSLEALFVDYGSERHGFLPIKEVSSEYFLRNPEEETDIRKLLREGQELVVQIEKEERGSKGAALTTFISLAGCYLVLMPNNPAAGGISRRIEGRERDQLKSIIDKITLPEEMSLIIRTAGVGKSSKELEWDVQWLLNYWEAIKEAALERPAPYLIHQESNLIIRAIRDHLRQDFEEIIIDDAESFSEASLYVQQVRPDFLTHVTHYQDPIPLFSRYELEHQIEKAHQSEIRLPSGGSLVIDTTEALTAIDINSAKATKWGDIEETAFNTNLEAAEEIAKQLRIRDIGGLIVIDFIDMRANEKRNKVEKALRDAVSKDRARIKIGTISEFGLLEMSRQRLRGALNTSTQSPCPRCAGKGTVRSIESLSLSIIHLIQQAAARDTNLLLHVHTPIEVATYLFNEQRAALEHIEKHTHNKVLVIPNARLLSPQYKIIEAKKNTLGTPSYKLHKNLKIEGTSSVNSLFKTEKQRAQEEPAINNFLIKPSAPPKKATIGIIKRLWDTLFGPENSPEKQKIPYYKPQPAAKSENNNNRPSSASKRTKGPKKNTRKKTAPSERKEQRPSTSLNTEKKETSTPIKKPIDQKPANAETASATKATSAVNTKKSNSPNNSSKVTRPTSTAPEKPVKKVAKTAPSVVKTQNTSSPTEKMQNTSPPVEKMQNTPTPEKKVEPSTSATPPPEKNYTEQKSTLKQIKTRQKKVTETANANKE